jgi:IclR family transcriptional regulator, pca regulon regulatory protein
MANKRSDEEAMASRTFVSAFARGLAAIEAFGPENRTMTVADMAENLGVDRAVARRLLLTLVQLGYAHVHNRRFELTTKVLRLANSFLASAGLGTSLQPILDGAARRIGETVSLSVLDETDVVFVARSDVPGRRLSYVVTAGMRLPAFTAASGRVLLAQRPFAEVHALLARTQIKRLTRRTILNKREIMAQIGRARNDGYSINDQEIEDGVVSISLPVFNRSAVAVAAINASSGIARANDARLKGEVKQRLGLAAEELARMLP